MARFILIISIQPNSAVIDIQLAMFPLSQQFSVGFLLIENNCFLTQREGVTKVVLSGVLSFVAELRGVDVQSVAADQHLHHLRPTSSPP